MDASRRRLVMSAAIVAAKTARALGMIARADEMIQ
jgi:hypothetical protein